MTIADIIRKLRGHANSLVVTLKKEELLEMATVLETVERETQIETLRAVQSVVKKNGSRSK